MSDNRDQELTNLYEELLASVEPSLSLLENLVKEEKITEVTKKIDSFIGWDLSKESQIGEGTYLIKELKEVLETFRLYKIYLEKVIERGNRKLHQDNNDAIDLESIASIATAYDASGKPDLIHTASVLDSVLTFFSKKNIKKKADEELDKLKQRYKDRDFQNNYVEPSKQIAKFNNIEKGSQALEKAFEAKTYRPMEQALSTRSCPDHPGNSLMRIGEDTYQCSLDRKIYPYSQGFTLNSGNKVPGSAVQNQNRLMYENVSQNQAFDTREERTKK